MRPPTKQTGQHRECGLSIDAVQRQLRSVLISCLISPRLPSIPPFERWDLLVTSPQPNTWSGEGFATAVVNALVSQAWTMVRNDAYDI